MPKLYRELEECMDGSCRNQPERPVLVARKAQGGSVMTQASKLISPLDADYAEHREKEERRRATREWLERRERELGFVKDAPPVVPKIAER